MVSGANVRILVVEDESLVAMLIEDIIADLGHDVAGVAGRLEDALRMARDLPIDLAVVDLNLNGERTDAIAAILKERRVPIIFATGYGAAGLSDEWQGAMVLQKPFQPADLEAAIASVAN